MLNNNRKLSKNKPGIYLTNYPQTFDSKPKLSTTYYFLDQALARNLKTKFMLKNCILIR